MLRVRLFSFNNQLVLLLLHYEIPEKLVTSISLLKAAAVYDLRQITLTDKILGKADLKARLFLPKDFCIF